MFPKKNRSNVWEYYLKDPNSPGQVKCRICKSFFKYSGNTSNLWDHVKRKHSTVLEAEKLVTELEQLDDVPNISMNDQPSTSTGNIFVLIVLYLSNTYT